MKHSFVGDLFEMKKKENNEMKKWNKKFYLIWCWFISFCLIDKGFHPVQEFVFCNKLDWIRR